jgi:hypothetical protein
MKRQLAQSDAPAVLNSLVLAGGASRGGTVLKIVAPRNGSFLLSVDIPSLAEYSSYVCSLSSPSGTVVWSGTVSAEQAKDTIQIRVPAGVTQPGENTLVVQGVGLGGTSGAHPNVLVTYKFILELH